MYATETDGVLGSTSIVNGAMATSQVAASFSAVSCVSRGACTAVGGDGDGQPIYATETGGVWGAVTALQASGSGSSFTGVSCTDLTDCSAIGTRAGNALYSTESAGVWSAPTTIASGSGTVVATSLSCTGAGNCTAVGYDAGLGGKGPGIYLTQTDGTWSAPTTLSVPSSPGSGTLYGVSCTDANDCTAVGDANAPNSDTGAHVYATEVDGTWGTPTVLSGTPGGTGELTGVSCVDDSSCVAVGFDGDSEPISTSSSAPVLTSVAPTVSPTGSKRGSASGGTVRWSPTWMAFVPGRDLLIGQARHGGARPAASPRRRQGPSQLGSTGVSTRVSVRCSPAPSRLSGMRAVAQLG